MNRIGPESVSLAYTAISIISPQNFLHRTSADADVPLFCSDRCDENRTKRTVRSIKRGFNIISYQANRKQASTDVITVRRLVRASRRARRTGKSLATADGPISPFNHRRRSGVQTRGGVLTGILYGGRACRSWYRHRRRRRRRLCYCYLILYMYYYYSVPFHRCMGGTCIRYVRTPYTLYADKKCGYVTSPPLLAAAISSYISSPSVHTTLQWRSHVRECIYTYMILFSLPR